MKKVKVGKSKIHGNGLFADEPIKRGDVIQLVHTMREIEPGLIKTTPTLTGRNYNHSDEPNSLNVIDGDNRYLIALKEIEAGGEITTNYRTNPDLEQPEDFTNDNYISFDYDDTLTTPEGFKLAQQMNKEGNNLYVITARDKITPQMIERAEAAGIPKENIIPAGSDQEKVRIIKENNITKHIDNKDSVIKALGDKGELFSPDAYPDLKADFVEMKLSDDDLNKLQEGGFIVEESPDKGIITQEEIDAANNAMMKARLAYAYMHGNPAAQRMVVAPDQPYDFGDGMTGTHYMASMDNYAVPQIQDINGQLMLGDYGPESMESIRFDNPEDAEYFAEHYKEITPDASYREEYKRGGEKDGDEPKRKKTQFQPGTYDPNETAGYILDEQEVVVPGKATNWGKAAIAYEKRNPEEEFINKKKKQYLKNNKNLIIDKWGTKTGYGNKDAISSYNWPDYLVDNFKKEYDYNKNTAVVKKVGKQEGWNPNRRTEYVGNLNDTQRGIVAESKYGSKLQPTYWDRTLAGLATLASKFSPELRDAMNKGNMPGLTQKESQEILNAKMTKIPFTDIDLPFSIPTGGLESFAALEIPGTIPANYLKNTGLSTGSSYKEMPSWYSGEKMANVTDTDVTALNPLTYAGLEAIPELGINLAKGAYKAGSVGVDLVKTNPQAWFKTPEQILETPGLYSSAMGRTSWKDPVGKLNKFVDDAKIKSSYKRENALLDKYPGFENRNTRIPLQQEEQLKRLEIEKAIEERNLRRTKLPIKQVLTEQGTKLGGGQGRIFVNTLNPEEVIKIGTFPGGSEDLANLIQTGKNLEGMPLMENVAFPTKGFSLDPPLPKGTIRLRPNTEAVQFMPWKGNPLSAENPINKSLGFGVPSDKAKRELQYMVELLDENKVGIDYFGQNNIIYDPATDSYKLVDLNYVDNPKSQFDWNNLDKSVKQRIEDKFGYEIPKEVPKELPGSPKTFKSSLGSMDMSRYEIKNPDYFTQLLNTYDSRRLSNSNKQFYKDLIANVKKQNGIATERQYNELQRLRTGNFNFGKKGYSNGGPINLFENQRPNSKLNKFIR